MKKRFGIVNVNLEYEIPKGQKVKDFLFNVELPKEYVEDSFEFVKVITEEVPSPEEIQEEMELHNADEAGAGDSRWSYEDAEYHLLLSDKYNN